MSIYLDASRAANSAREEFNRQLFECLLNAHGKNHRDRVRRDYERLHESFQRAFVMSCAEGVDVGFHNGQCHPEKESDAMRAVQAIALLFIDRDLKRQIEYAEAI